MGQQQLLLLVLSTVIVGLATVAGIQAFDENQSQATQDALTQRGVDIASDLKGVINKPKQLGGIGSSTTDVTKALKRAGYSPTGGSSDKVDVPGVSGTASCTLDSIDPDATGSNNAASITCTAAEAPSDVTVNLKANGDVKSNVGS